MKENLITVTTPLLPDLEEFHEELRKIWDKKWITNMGDYHKKLEDALAEYKCLNEKKKIFLLSKHEHTDLMEELKGFRLDHLFDDVIHIDPRANKAEYITAFRPIFIDDSNAERLNIKTKLNIPVFAPEMIDVLN